MNLLSLDPYFILDTFLLIFVRTTSMMMIMPFFNNSNIPTMSKVTISLFTSVIMMTMVPLDGDYSSFYVVTFAIDVIKEVIIGWLLGFGAYIVFSSLTLAGQFVDYQIGFSMVNVFDPLSEMQITVTGNFYYFVFMLMFLVTRSYYYIFRALKESFSLIPLGEINLSDYLYTSLMEYMTHLFVIALQISVPIFFVMLITNVILGIFARTVPQLNMFVIGFPIKIILGLFILYVTLSLFGRVTSMVMTEFKEMLETMLKGMAS